MTTTSTPEPKAVAEYLGADARVTGGTLAAVFALVGGLAVSRAAANVLTPAALTALVAGVAATLGSVGWVNGLYGGALDAIEGAVAAPTTASEGRDPFGARSLWSSAVAWGLGAAAWAAAGAGLAAVALDGKRSPFIVVFVVMAGLAGTAGVVANAVARRTGIDGVRRLGVATAAPVPLRRRAWRQLALPMAAAQFLVNAGVSVLVFHDYTTGNAFGPKALTETVALADVLTTVVIVCCLLAWFAGRWGQVDAALGRIELDDPVAQTVPAKAPIGRQGIVYLGLIGAFVVGPLLGLLLPPTPSLLAVVLVRAGFAAVLVYLVVGVAYVRSALNRLAEQEADA
ncbi:MAG: hypothetical protein QOE35_3970 [Actinomycetota bacterium]|jgi:hypothetical protein